MTNDSHSRQDTRMRLLQVGVEIFARDGFRGATVRSIARLAKANVAAVNYHFANKEGLYRAVLEHSFTVAMAKYPPDLGLEKTAGPAEQLHAFVTSMLLRLLDEGRPAWHGQLMIRELADPSPVLDRVVERTIRPLYERLAAIVGNLLGPTPSDETVRLSAFSIMGQCLFYRSSRPVVARLARGRFDSARIRRIADHVTAFSLQAIQGQRNCS